MTRDGDDQSRFGPLTCSEKDRFLKHGPGFPSSCRWLQAALFSISNYDIFWNPRLGCRPFDMEDRRDREFILSEDYRHLASTVLAYDEAESQLYFHNWRTDGIVGQMEPMTAYSADTLIRFAMNRHDATDMLCSDRIGNPVGTMMHAMETNPKSHSTNGIVNVDAIILYMVRHMPLPIATHPFSSLQDIVNAVCYGCHGNGRSDPSEVGASGEHRIGIMAPLSGTMEYHGPPCSPSLMAHVLDGGELYAIAGKETMIVSMPGVETMNLNDTAAELSNRLSFLGNLSPFNASPGFHNLEWLLPVTDYGTMMQAIRSGRYEETVPCVSPMDRIPDTASGLYIDAMADAERPDGLPDPEEEDDWLADTYAAMVDRRRSRMTAIVDEKDYGIMPDMADIAWALTFDRPASTDWTLVHDLMMTALGRENVTLADEAIMLPGAGAWAGFARTLPMRDPVISDAELKLTHMMTDLAKTLIRMSMEKPDSVGVMLIPSHALDMFFTDLHHGLPYGFALQTMLSRSFMGADGRRDPGFHGLVMVMPHKLRIDEDTGAVEGFMPLPVDTTLPIAGIIDDMGLHPDVLMVP